MGARSRFRWKLHPSNQAWPLLFTSRRDSDCQMWEFLVENSHEKSSRMRGLKIWAVQRLTYVLFSLGTPNWHLVCGRPLTGKRLEVAMNRTYMGWLLSQGAPNGVRIWCHPLPVWVHAPSLLIHWWHHNDLTQRSDESLRHYQQKMAGQMAVQNIYIYYIYMYIYMNVCVCVGVMLFYLFFIKIYLIRMTNQPKAVLHEVLPYTTQSIT